ncbi:GNAT family N-acetyltransferase [Sabulicella rubraurantiaca]|uniref:GNAT family N-acetyltransferase n=1 Tax=Sabulicella rubraurantiaca TaxID=2811429 RepID=UPI001A957799|nr:GNAT family N-acetyltransferase [Sabulicella rubraurantiaca]
MSITYRPATNEDLEPATRIVQDAYNDLRVRHGLPPSIALGPPLFQAFSLAEPSSSLWVAEAEGALQGFAFSWMRQSFWFLAQLFVRPGTQSQGIGQAMLSRTLRHAEENGAENRALITMAYNTASTALYIRNGLYPREPLLRMIAAAPLVAARIGPSKMEVAPIEPWPQSRDWLSRIDEEVLGFRRESHHAFLLGGFTARALSVAQAGRPLGYAYVSPTGHIGPLAVLPEADPSDALRAVVRDTLELQPKQVSMVVPGRAQRTLDTAFELGFRIDEPFVLLSARPFGAWTHYQPSNPGIM